MDDALETYDEREQALGSSAAGRALRDPADGRPALARAPGGDGLPREGVHLHRAFAQKDPLVEYRGEGHAMFEELGGAIRQRSSSRSSTSPCGSRPPSRRCRQPAAGSTTSTRRPPVRTRSPPPGAPRRRSPHRLPGAAVRPGAGGQRAQGHRPQRPVLVRVGEEVQALPRRLGDETSSPLVPARVSGDEPDRDPRVAARGGLRRRSRLLALGYDDDPLGPIDAGMSPRVGGLRLAWLGGVARAALLLARRVDRADRARVAAGVLLVRQRAWLDLAFFLTAFLECGSSSPSSRTGSAAPARTSARPCRCRNRPPSRAGTRPRGWRASALSPSSPSERLPSRRARTWLWAAVVVGARSRSLGSRSAFTT